MLDGFKERMKLELAIKARIACGLIKGYREAKPNLKRLYKEMTQTESDRTDLEELREMIEESHARVDPEVRKKQLEEKARLEKLKKEQDLN